MCNTILEINKILLAEKYYLYLSLTFSCLSMAGLDKFPKYFRNIFIIFSQFHANIM